MTNDEVVNALKALSTVVAALDITVQRMRQHHAINGDEVLDEIREVRRAIQQLHNDITK